MAKTRHKAEFGDFQTPSRLAEDALRVVAQAGFAPRSIVEPTCGQGNFLRTASQQFPQADRLLGVEINPAYAAEAHDIPRAEIRCDDFFTVDWPTLLSGLPEPLLVAGNPPWVTNAELGAWRSSNLPEKENASGLNGLAAKTGKSNFDISEWMLSRLVKWLEGRDAMLAMLCKTSVARKVVHQAWKAGVAIGRLAIHRIDAAQYFGATVDACLLVGRFSSASEPSRVCRQFRQLGSTDRLPDIGFRDGKLIADVAAFEKWQHLQGGGSYRWRSGIKHDCRKVMEFVLTDGGLVNGFGERVDLEPDFLFPMLKSSELARGRPMGMPRRMLVTQRRTGDATDRIADIAPKTWRYLNSHAELLNRRKSSIYQGRPPFSVFGIGEYSFAPFKVAISGFYKKLDFTVVGSHGGRPIVLDDTASFVACATAEEAESIARLLNSDVAREFYSAFIFWDAKRPITVSVLELLDILAVADGSRAAAAPAKDRPGGRM